MTYTPTDGALFYLAVQPLASRRPRKVLEHQRNIGQPEPSSRATFAPFEHQERPKFGGKSVNLIYEPHRMPRRCTGSSGFLITGFHLLHRDVNGLRLGCVLAHFSEIGGKPVVKQEFRIGRSKCERPKCLRRTTRLLTASLRNVRTASNTA
jgi:hypothetical protein